MKILYAVGILFLLPTAIFAQETPEKTPPPPPPKVSVEKEKPIDGIIEFPDVEAEFPGGADALRKFISENVVYPEAAVRNNIYGKVYLSFIVEKDGRITNVKVEKGVHPTLDQEAMRVARKMPNWEPAEKDEHIVRTKCSLPIVFVIEQPFRVKRHRRHKKRQ